ncbi:hypothetical protein WKH57_11315 [Niallia taxi]|uniref:hypothetical protein n=1 Tax=Niallia taxi TaxID=2499688 RepID=UPI003175AAE6
MRVKCINNSNLYITENKIYTVYEGEFIQTSGGKKFTLLKIEDDYGSIIPYEAQFFSVVSNNIENYVISKIEEEKYKLTHKYISYKGFWSMLYEEMGTSLDDFWAAKKDIYKKEMSIEEMKGILAGVNDDEKDFILELLIENKDNHFIDEVIQICRKKLHENKITESNDLLFKYLNEFQDDRVNDFFIEYLTDNYDVNEEINKIVSSYFN